MSFLSFWPLFFFFFKFYLYLFLAVLGLRCCAGLSLASERRATLEWQGMGLSSPGLLLSRAPALGHVAFGSRAHRLRNCGAWAQLPCHMWDPPRPGIEPLSLELAGGFFTTEPPGEALASY